MRHTLVTLSVFLVLPLALLPPVAHAKNKKAPLTADVLHAQTVLVVIDPQAGEPVTDPSANRNARNEVEQALTKWGRYRLVLDGQTPDLVFTVRKGTGRSVTPTVGNLPTDNRPVIFQPNDGGVRAGQQRGRPPDLSQPGIGPPQDTGPRPQTEVGGSEDTLEVYRGGVQYPLDAPPIWRYSGKDALRPPKVPAVEQFQKAVDESEKIIASQQKQKKP